jgi:hypothetical protein
LLAISSGTLLTQVLISAAGIAVLCGIAYYADWSKRVDRVVKGPSRDGGAREIARDFVDSPAPE